MYKIGNGIDIHQLIKNKSKKMVLGGLEIPSEYSIVAHSDGDVVLHSLSDAILGAIQAGDIGEYFSDEDSKNEGISSIKIFKFCLQKMNDKYPKSKIQNIDLTIVCEHVKIGKWKQEIVDNLTKLTGCEKINVKATRFEQNIDFIQVNTVLLIK